MTGQGMIMLSLEAVRKIIEETETTFPHAECLTCECFLGLVAQLRIDSEPDARVFLNGDRVDRKQMHGCLGCDPCPPGDRYALYTREKGPSNLITL